MKKKIFFNTILKLLWGIQLRLIIKSTSFPSLIFWHLSPHTHTRTHSNRSYLLSVCPLSFPIFPSHKTDSSCSSDSLSDDQTGKWNIFWNFLPFKVNSTRTQKVWRKVQRRPAMSFQSWSTFHCVVDFFDKNTSPHSRNVLFLIFRKHI